MSRITLLDLVKRRGHDAEVGLVDETIKAIPELTQGEARSIKGTSFKALVRTGLPTVGFRDYNNGVDASKGTVEARKIETFLMTPRGEVDQQLAMENEEGPEALIAQETMAQVAAAMQFAATQFYYGATLDANHGFPGLGASVDASLIQDATGTSANAGASLWAVRWGKQDVSWVWGLGAAFQILPVRVGDITGANNKVLTGYISEVVARPGLAVCSKFSVGKVKNLTAQANKGLTDALIYKLLAKFPAQKPPTMMFTTKTQLELLRESRTATNATGAPAPMPTEVAGIPIFASESLLDTEAIV
jgi:hypothetical protein